MRALFFVLLSLSVLTPVFADPIKAEGPLEIRAGVPAYLPDRSARGSREAQSAVRPWLELKRKKGQKIGRIWVEARYLAQGGEEIFEEKLEAKFERRQLKKTVHLYYGNFGQLWIPKVKVTIRYRAQGQEYSESLELEPKAAGHLDTGY